MQHATSLTASPPSQLLINHAHVCGKPASTHQVVHECVHSGPEHRVVESAEPVAHVHAVVQYDVLRVVRPLKESV